ncbi:MAG: hypothetical protein AB7I48_26405 [Planctomycetaceae bacterium]
MKESAMIGFCVTAISLISNGTLFSQESAEPTPACAGEAAEEKSLPCSCAEYPLQDMGSGNYLYYSHYHETDCDDYATDYIIGSYYWPATCDVNCVGSPSARATCAYSPFLGLEYKIELAHEVFPGDPADPNILPNKLPPGPARHYGQKVNIASNRVYLHYTFSGESGPRYFKVFGIRTRTQFPGKPEYIFYALELSTEPGTSNEIQSVTALDGSKAYRGEFQFQGGTGGMRPVLILLHKD